MRPKLACSSTFASTVRLSVFERTQTASLRVWRLLDSWTDPWTETRRFHQAWLSLLAANSHGVLLSTRPGGVCSCWAKVLPWLS